MIPTKKQQETIDAIVQGFNENKKNQILKGVTGSGKTLMMSKIIEQLDLPALIMAPNKTLAAQLYEEMKSLLPNRPVEYFVSYYDYYRPEAYIPAKGLYLEKESSINETIDKMRHSATKSLLEDKNTVIIASVSCIYGIGAYEAYSNAIINIGINDEYTVSKLSRAFTNIAYENTIDVTRGKYKVQGNSIIIGPSHIDECLIKIIIQNGLVKEIIEFDPFRPEKTLSRNFITIAPNSHHIVAQQSLISAIENIKKELVEHVIQLNQEGKFAQAQRIEEKVNYDLMQLTTINTCKGIENYSRYFTNRKEGEHPPTLFEYFPKPYVLFLDESHICVPQVAAMFKGDSARKDVLINYGFRLPSAKDNRPMKFEEWDKIRGNTVFVSATPGEFELEISQNTVEQLIRPTGLLDPLCFIEPTATQMNVVLREIKENIKRNERCLMLTLTKKTAENLCEFLKTNNFKVSYIHGDLDTIERIKILHQFRSGVVDVLVGINLLREGIDVPECSLICIFEADQEGFLRTENSLIQMIGRAARHVNGKVILFADRITNSMQKALNETKRRREIQEKYNLENNIVPTSIKKELKTNLFSVLNEKQLPEGFQNISDKNKSKLIKKIAADLKKAIKEMNFELAAKLRDQRNLLLSIEIAG